MLTGKQPFKTDFTKTSKMTADDTGLLMYRSWQVEVGSILIKITFNRSIDKLKNAENILMTVKHVFVYFEKPTEK